MPPSLAHRGKNAFSAICERRDESVRQSVGESLAIRANLRYRRDFPLWETL
jgi:hypothetical protein